MTGLPSRQSDPQHQSASGIAGALLDLAPAIRSHDEMETIGMPMNYTKTALLLVALTAIFVAMGNVVGGTGGMIVAFVIAMIMNLLSLWKSDTIVLRLFRAKEVDESSEPELVGLVRALASEAGLPMPRVYIMESPQPNAFATGRSPSRSAVAVSTGLLRLLSREEVAGVVAHELAHIKNRDTLTMAIAATIGGAISMLAQYLQFGLLFGGGNRDGRGVGWIGALAAIIVAPMAAALVQMAISRSREYNADRMGAFICGNPRWLASALKKISVAAERIHNPIAETVPAAAHLFIVNPLSGRGIDNWFSTHPDVENRIAELEALAREMGLEGDRAAGGFGGGDAVWRTDQGASRQRGPWSPAPDSDIERGPWG
jgi:heat shock protein HtpX